MSMVRYALVAVFAGAFGIVVGCGGSGEQSSELTESASEAVCACPAVQPVQASSCSATCANTTTCSYKKDAGIPTTCTCQQIGPRTIEWVCH